MELVKTILVLFIVYFLHKIYNHQDYNDLLEGICSGPDNTEITDSTSEEDCTNRGEGYIWTDDSNVNTSLPYELWKLPDKDGNMIELKNIRPWKELSNSEIRLRGSDLPLSGALSINNTFRESYTGDEGPFKANESIATLLEQSTLEPPTDNLSGQGLQDYYAEKCYEKVVDYNNRGQLNSEYGDPKPVAFRINSYTENEIFSDPTITVEDSNKISTCEILGTKELDPRFTSNKNDWTKKYPIITPLGNLTQQDINMNNKYPENIISGCYAFIESEDGSKEQILIPSSIDTPSENDYNLAPTKYYDHCLALNGSCGTGGGVYVDNKWIPGENCHGYSVPRGDNIGPGYDSGIEIGHNQSTTTSAYKHNIKLSATIDGSIADVAKYSPEKRNLITPFGRDSYSDLQVKYKRNEIRNSIPGIKLQGPYYWKGPKIESSSSNSEWTTTSGINRMQSPNNDKTQPGNFGSKYNSREREYNYRLKKSDSLGENFIRDTIPAFWDTIYSEDPREGHGGAKQIYTLKNSNCDNKWFDGNQSDIGIGRAGIDDNDNITIDQIPHLSLMDGPSKYINSRFSGINNYRKVRGLDESLYPAVGGLATEVYRAPEVGSNPSRAGPILATPLTPTMSRSELLSSELGPTNPQSCRSGDPTREADWSTDTEAQEIYLDDNNYIGIENPLTLPKCTQATKCRCRPSSHEGSDPSKCYVDTGHCGVDQGLQECNRDESETPLTNKIYKKWTVKDKDGNDLVIQNLVPSITTNNQLAIDPDANNALVIHKSILDEAPAHLRNYSRSKGYDVDLENEKESREKLQEYYASECANIAKTYPNATGFAINNFEKNKLLNKRDGLGRCVSFNTSQSGGLQGYGSELNQSSSFKPCNSDSDCGFLTNEDTHRIDRNLKENPVNKYDLDNIHSTGLNFRSIGPRADGVGHANNFQAYNDQGERVYNTPNTAVPGAAYLNDGVDNSVNNTVESTRNQQRSPIETCMSFPTGLRNNNIGEPNAWHSRYDLKPYEGTAQIDGPKTGEEADSSNKNPRYTTRTGTNIFNLSQASGGLEHGGNRNSYDVFNMASTHLGLAGNYSIIRDNNDSDDYGLNTGGTGDGPNTIPINVRRDGINPNYMPWSLNETQSMINDIKVSSYGLFGEWNSYNIPQYEGKSNVLLSSLQTLTPDTDSRDWTNSNVRAAEKRIDDILHGTDPNGNPSQHTLVEAETKNPNPVCIIYGKGMEGKYDKYPIPSSISAVNDRGIISEVHEGWQKKRTYNKNSIKGTQLPCISNDPQESLIPSLNEDGSISQSDQLNNNNPGKGSISCKEMGIHAPSTKDALLNAAQWWHDENGIPIYGKNRSMYGSFGNDRLTNLYPISDYSKKGDDGVSHYTTYEKGNDGLIKWKDYKIKSGYGWDKKGAINPPTPLHQYRGDNENPIDARKPEFQIQAEWSPLQVYKLENIKTPEEIENERNKEEDKNACSEMWLDSPTSKMTGPTNKVHLRKNITDPNLNNSPGVLAYGKSGNTCGGCYKPNVLELDTSVRMQVDRDRDNRSDQCYVNNTCDVSLQPGSLTPCNKQGIQPVVINGIEKPPLKWKRWALKRYYDSDGDGIDDSSEDVEMKSWANTERYKQTKCIDSEGNDISTVNDEGVRVPETKEDCEELGHTWKLESMGGWEVLKDGTLYDWCPSTNAEKAEFGVRCRNSGNPRASENTPRKFSPPLEGKTPPPLTKDLKEELQWMFDNDAPGDAQTRTTLERYLNDLNNVPLRKDKFKNVGMAKLNRNEDGTIKNVSVGLGYDHDHPESQRSKVLQRGNSWWGSKGFNTTGYLLRSQTNGSVYEGKQETIESGGADGHTTNFNLYNANIPTSYGAVTDAYFPKSDGFGSCVCHPDDEYCNCGRRQGGSFIFPSKFQHEVLRNRRLNKDINESSINFSYLPENIRYTQKLYNDGKLRKSAVGASEDQPYTKRSPDNILSEIKYDLNSGPIKNICEPPQISSDGRWYEYEGGKSGKYNDQTYKINIDQPNAHAALHSSSGSCLPRGILPASSKDFANNGSSLVTPYRPSELLRDILTDEYDSFKPYVPGVHGPESKRWSQLSDESTGEPLPEHTKESINVVRDFINNFSNLDEPWHTLNSNEGIHITPTLQPATGVMAGSSSTNVKDRYISGGNYRKLSQLDQVVLPLHPNRKNMTIEELQEDAAQKCTDHINTLFSRGIFPEKWRSKTGFLLDTPSSRIYKNPEGLFNQSAGNTLNLWHSLGDHTNANQFFGTGLRPINSTESDGNVNKPWVCEPRVNLPKEIMSSETEALYVSGIDIEELRRNGANANIGNADEEWSGIHSASFTNNNSNRRYHYDWSPGGAESHENTVDRSKVNFPQFHRDSTYKCENSIPALEQCKENSIAADDPNCTSSECMSCVTDALTSKEHNKDCWMKAPDTSHVQWERLKCWEIFDSNFQDITDDWTSYSANIPESRRQICERLKNRTINPVPYLTRDMASPSNNPTATDHLWYGPHEAADKWYLGPNKIIELTTGAMTETPGTLTPNDFEKLWNGQDINNDTTQGELRITREGVAKNNDGDVIYHTGYPDGEVPLPKRIRSGSGVLGSHANEVNQWPSASNFMPSGSTNKLATFNWEGATYHASSLPASHPDPNVRTQGCHGNARERYDGGQGAKDESETCNSFLNDANGKYVRLIGQDINGNPHYAKPDLSWHIYYKCDESWSDQVCKAGGKYVGRVPKNNSEAANEYLQGLSHGPKPAFIPSKDLMESELIKPIWMDQEEWTNLINRTNEYNPDNNYKKPKKSKFSSVEYNEDQNSQEIINETRDEANKNIYKVPPSAQSRPDNEFQGPFIIPPNKGGISDGALRAFIGQHKAANGIGNHPEEWTYDDINGSQEGNLDLQAEDLQPCCGWVIVPHDALYPSERMTAGGYYTVNNVNKTENTIYNERYSQSAYDTWNTGLTQSSAGWNGVKDEVMRYEGIWQNLRKPSWHDAKGLGPGQLQAQAVHGLRAHTDHISSTPQTKSTQSDNWGGFGIQRNGLFTSRISKHTPKITEFVGIFAPSNKPENGPPISGWEINPYRSGYRDYARKPVPSIKVTKGIDKDHTHRVCGVGEGYTYNAYHDPTGFNSNGLGVSKSEPLYALQNVDGFSKNRIYRSWSDGDATFNLSNGERSSSAAGIHNRPHAASGGFWDNSGGSALTSPYTKQYTSHLGMAYTVSGNNSELISHPCRGMDAGDSGDYEHLSKDFFVLYDDSQKQLEERCTEFNIDPCTQDNVNNYIQTRNNLLSELNIPSTASQSEIDNATQMQNTCRRLGLLQNDQTISSNPDQCNQTLIDETMINNERQTLTNTLGGYIDQLESSITELTVERNNAADNWMNVDPDGASAAGIEPFNNDSLIEGFVNYPIVEGLCIDTNGYALYDINDQSSCEGTQSEPTTNTWIEDNLASISQEIYERSNQLLGNATNLLSEIQTAQSNLNQSNLNQLRETQSLIGTNFDNFQSLQRQTTNFRDSTRRISRNIICQNIIQQLPVKGCITNPQPSICSVLSDRDECNSQNLCSWNTISNSCTTRDVDHLCNLRDRDSCEIGDSNVVENQCKWVYDDIINNHENNCDNLINNIQSRGEKMKNECELDGLWKGSCGNVTGTCVGNYSDGPITQDDCASLGYCSIGNKTNQTECESRGICSNENILTEGECTGNNTWQQATWTQDPGIWIESNNIKSRSECEKSQTGGTWIPGSEGSELSDRCVQEPDESQTNVNIKDLSSFSNYLENCNNPFGNFPGHEGRKCGNIDDNNFPISFESYHNEYNQLRDDFITSKNKFDDIKSNERLRLNLYKKVYGDQKFNEGYIQPDDLENHPVSITSSEVPDWLNNDVTNKTALKEGLEQLQNQKITELNTFNDPNNVNSIPSLESSVQLKQNLLNILDNDISNLTAQKETLIQRPVSCRECIPCIQCNDCMTLTAFSNANECPVCPHCNVEVDTEIRTQTNICENRKSSLLNQKDNELNNLKVQNINNDLIEEKNSKLSTLRKKKILAISSERKCDSERSVLNVSKNELTNNIRRYQLKNDELKERIEWERNISWLDKLKGITKPFIATRDYTFKEIEVEDTNIDDLFNENP